MIYSVGEVKRTLLEMRRQASTSISVIGSLYPAVTLATSSSDGTSAPLATEDTPGMEPVARAVFSREMARNCRNSRVLCSVSELCS